MNFKDLDDLIHKSDAKEIVLDSDIVLDDGEESEYLEGIKLDIDDLVINGNGHLIDACGKHEYSNAQAKSGFGRSFSKMDFQRTAAERLKIAAI